MISQIETKLIPLSAIEIGHRDRQPSEAEVNQMASSVEQGGLLTAIGVQTNGDSYRLLYGATRLLAVQKLGWSEVSAVLYEGTEEELASAEIVENLERRHLDKDERDRLTRRLVELRTKEIQGAPRKELDDNLSHNSSQEPKTHPKTKVKGSKRGRPVTAEGQAKKEIAAKTGQSRRNVQRRTSEKPMQVKARGAVKSKDEALIDFSLRIKDFIRRIGTRGPEHFAATSVSVDELGTLGKFFTDLADLKSSCGNPTTGFVSQGNDVDPVSSGKSMTEAHEANEAQDATSETDPTTDEAIDEQQDSDNGGGENVESAWSVA